LKAKPPLSPREGAQGRLQGKVSPTEPASRQGRRRTGFPYADFLIPSGDAHLRLRLAPRRWTLFRRTGILCFDRRHGSIGGCLSAIIRSASQVISVCVWLHPGGLWQVPL
jgi:hypothetical protein